MTQSSYRYAGAAAMVELHEKEMRSFVRVWTQARGDGVPLPKTEDESYASYEALLRHVLDAAQSYMRWVCRSLELKAPDFAELPEPVEAGEMAAFLDRMLAAWGAPLVDLDEEKFYRPNYPSSGEGLCLELMLEHAIVHPMRHRLQLERLMAVDE